jgi:hypothetical protein
MATIQGSRCCCLPINCPHLPPSWRLSHRSPLAACAKTWPLCHDHSNILLTLPTLIALSAAASQHCNCNPGSSPPPQLLPPLCSCCYRCCNLLHTLCPFYPLSLLCLLPVQLSPTATAPALLTTTTCHCPLTNVATDTGLPPSQPPLSAPTPLLLLLLLPCHQPPPPTTLCCNLCHLTPTVVDCCIFHCPIFSLA